MKKTPHAAVFVGQDAARLAQQHGCETASTPFAKAERWELEEIASGKGPYVPQGHDTIALLALSSDGHIAGGCSTSGLRYKMPGRVGDSPFVGCGLYVDEKVGGAGATGVGENILRYCGSFLAVELCGRARSPEEACRKVIARIIEGEGRPASELSVNFIALDKEGRFGAAGTDAGFILSRRQFDESGKNTSLPSQLMIDKSNWEIFQSAISSLSDCIEAVSHEAIEWKESRGRILFEDIVSDRPSPPIDVSAMDGYAIRLSDIGNEPIGVAGTIFAGQPVQPLPLGQAMRVFTGAPVPKEAECVLRREDTEELSNAIRVKSNIAFPNQGENIRKQGENAEQGQTVLQIGSRVTPSAMSAMATFGYPEVDVHRRIRIIIVNTGDELRNIHETVEDWQIRDSNGPCLEMLLANDPTFDLVARVRLPDDLASLRRVGSMDPRIRCDFAYRWRFDG